jgi:ABC-type uncharacterized transport system permease subunit
VRAGIMDFVLLRPVSAEVLLSFRRLSLLDGANVILGIALTLYASHRFWLVAVRRYASAEG